MRLNENEIASREWYEKRFNDEKNEFRQFRYTELRTFKDREKSPLKPSRTSSWTKT